MQPTAPSARSQRPPLPAGFGAIWVCVALDLVGFGLVLPILPLYAEDFGASPASATALVAAFSAAQLVFSPIWGRVSDRVGRKPVLVLSLVGTAVGSLVTGLAGSLTILFVGRILDGISGASIAVAQAAVADVAPPQQRARLLGLLGAAFGVGFVAGPALGGLAALGGPKLPFFVAAALAAANAAVAMRRLPETLHAPRPARRAIDPIAWSRPDVRPLLLVAFVALLAFSGFEGTFALLGAARFDLDIASTGGVFAAVGAVLVVVQVRLVHPAVARLGERGALRAGLLLNAAGLLTVAVAHTWALLAVALLALVVGQGLVMPTLTSLVAGRVEAGQRGGVLGVQQAAGGLARVVGPVTAGLAFEHVAVAAPYVAGAGLLVAASVAVGLVADTPTAGGASGAASRDVAPSNPRRTRIGSD